MLRDSFNADDVDDVEIESECFSVDGVVPENMLEGVEMAAQSVVNDGGQDSSTTYTSSDNVINAAKAFRPDGYEFTETLKTQYATSKPKCAIC